MTREEKIKVLAELDCVSKGCWIEYACSSGISGRLWHKFGWNRNGATIDWLPDYLTNYDAIIPLIQKQSRATLVRVVLSFKGQNDVSRMVDWLQYTPEQLADALIKAVGKWRD